MSHYRIVGGKTLSGNITVSSAKNSAVSILCASAMIQGKVLLHDLPNIQEVHRIIELLESIYISCNWINETTLEIDSSNTLKMHEIDKQACMRTRSSLMLLGALAGRESSYKLYKTGGCKLGERSIRPHLFALNQFGLQVESKQEYYEVKNPKTIKSAKIVMYESGDTTTENAILAAVLAEGTTTLEFASSNYMVQDLCHFLVAAGAKIDGIGTTTLTIKGVKKLKAVEHSIMKDPIIAMTWISLAITTKSPLTIKACPIDFLKLELEKLRVMGQQFTIQKSKTQSEHFELVDIQIIPSELTALPDKLYGRPFPGLNIDNLPFFVPICTQAKGRTLIHDWVYENRAIYYMDLQKLGAKMFLVDPHRVFVEGKTALKANELMSPDALRPAMAVLIAMIAAKGTSVLRNSYNVERGYEHVIETLQSVGVQIEAFDA